MGKIHLIPDRNRLEESLALRQKYGCQWEFNDFMFPDVLDDSELVTEIIDRYTQVVDDFSQDTMHGAFFDVTVHSIDKRIRETSMLRVRQSMDIAKTLGLRGVVFHTNRIQGLLEPKYVAGWHRTNEYFFRKILDEYPDQQIFMENMFDESPWILRDFAEQMSDCPNFGICLDYAHANISETSPRQWMKALAPYVRHMHINDNDGREDLHLALGQGQIDWKLYREEMEEFKVDSSVLIEVTELEKQYASLGFIANQT